MVGCTEVSYVPERNSGSEVTNPPEIRTFRPKQVLKMVTFPVLEWKVLEPEPYLIRLSI